MWLLVGAEWRTTALLLLTLLLLQDNTLVYLAGGAGRVQFPSFRNQRNFWLEYSTPASTILPAESSDSPLMTRPPPPGPHFAHHQNRTELKVALGKTLKLDCTVADLRDFQVSWFRLSNESLSVLTVGRSLFSTDGRYALALLRNRSHSNFALHIRPVSESDGGKFVCQISTHPPSTLVKIVRVIVPQIAILDDEGSVVEKEKHFKPGSTIRLRCVVQNYVKDFGKVVWTKDQQRIVINQDNQDIRLKTLLSEQLATSHLFLAEAEAVHSGVYECSLEKLENIRAKLNLHVLNGEEPAAITGTEGDSEVSNAAVTNTGVKAAENCNVCYFIVVIPINLLF